MTHAPPPRATYRIQLREGVGFAEAERLLPRLHALGISHLYLSPILRAVPGSTHGYDVIDPTSIEPSLGGREGFARLAEAAHARGLGVILDIVPNHTAFSLESPWLRDVLRHGEASRWARHFDIEWEAGRLVLPFLPSPFEAMLEAGHVGAGDAPEGPVLRVEELEVPLAPFPLSEAERAGDPDALRLLHDRQAWRLAHWELERDGVTHRRFFNVTGLIGMRVEDPAVFDSTHALILSLVREGLVDALRVDHVDGLADPGAYLARLGREAGVPIWIEKILVGDEALPPWPVEGTTGYEAGAAIARVLTDAEGLGRLDALWRRVTGEERSWEEALAQAKAQVIRQDLAAELGQLRRLASAAAEASGEIEAGDESLREAILALLVEIPRYRTYLEAPDDETFGPRRREDLRLLDAAEERAAAGLNNDAALRWLAREVGDGATEAARRLRTRFQQVTGALMAKSQEDTAFFRFTRCLAHCEVGGEPGDPAWTPARFGAWCAARTGRDLSLTSSHDTKRAEDARARLLAMTHDPEAFEALLAASEGVPGAAEVPASLRWYIVQSLLAIWEEGRRDIAARLAAHVEKALREAREVTTWSHPRPEAEARAEDLSRALALDWAARRPPGLDRLAALGARISLAQVALKCAMPGIPDFYQGAEGPLHHLTDPDNRLAVDWEGLGEVGGPPVADAALAGRKGALTRDLLRLRAERPELFAGAARVEGGEGGPWTLVREGPTGRLAVAVDLHSAEAPVRVEWRPAEATVGDSGRDSGDVAAQ